MNDEENIKKIDQILKELRELYSREENILNIKQKEIVKKKEELKHLKQCIKVESLKAAVVRKEIELEFYKLTCVVEARNKEKDSKNRSSLEKAIRNMESGICVKRDRYKKISSESVELQKFLAKLRRYFYRQLEKRNFPEKNPYQSKEREPAYEGCKEKLETIYREYYKKIEARKKRIRYLEEEFISIEMQQITKYEEIEDLKKSINFLEEEIEQRFSIFSIESQNRIGQLQNNLGDLQYRLNQLEQQGKKLIIDKELRRKELKKEKKGIKGLTGETIVEKALKYAETSIALERGIYNESAFKQTSSFSLVNSQCTSLEASIAITRNTQQDITSEPSLNPKQNNSNSNLYSDELRGRLKRKTSENPVESSVSKKLKF